MYVYTVYTMNVNLQRTFHDKMLSNWGQGSSSEGFDRWWRCLPPRRRRHH